MGIFFRDFFPPADENRPNSLKIELQERGLSRDFRKGLFLDFMRAVQVYKTFVFLVVLECRNQHNPADFECQFEFDKRLQETLIAVRGR